MLSGVRRRRRKPADQASQVHPATPLPVGRQCAGLQAGGEGHFAVLDDGTKIASPRFLRRAEKKLRRAQKDLSRRQKGSRNREKARVKAARAHARVADATSTTSSPRRSSAKTRR
jgi:probable transposase